jgi:chromosome segregation ATPase
VYILKIKKTIPSKMATQMRTTKVIPPSHDTGYQTRTQNSQVAYWAQKINILKKQLEELDARIEESTGFRTEAANFVHTDQELIRQHGVNLTHSQTQLAAYEAQLKGLHSARVSLWGEMNTAETYKEYILKMRPSEHHEHMNPPPPMPRPSFFGRRRQ